jgi:hypothetical protein
MNGPEKPPKRRIWRRIIINTLICSLIGAVAGYFVGRALKQSGAALPFPDWSLAEFASILIGVALLFSAVYTLVATTSVARWKAMVEKQPLKDTADLAIDPAALVEGRRAAWVAAIAGLAVFVPPIAAHAGLDLETRGAVAVVLGGLLALESWINWQLWRDGDELTRTVIAQTGAFCFWVLQLGLFIWAALAKLDLVADVDSWALVTILMGTYLVASVTISVRRGLVNV